MKPYLYRATFDRSLIEHIVKTGGRLDDTMRVSIEAFGGRLVRCHLIAASIDPIGFVEFPEDIAARSWNAFYATQPGVTHSTIERMLDEADVAELAHRVRGSSAAATAHR